MDGEVEIPIAAVDEEAVEEEEYPPGPIRAAECTDMGFDCPRESHENATTIAVPPQRIQRYTSTNIQGEISGNIFI